MKVWCIVLAGVMMVSFVSAGDEKQKKDDFRALPDAELKPLTGDWEMTFSTKDGMTGTLRVTISYGPLTEFAGKTVDQARLANYRLVLKRGDKVALKFESPWELVLLPLEKGKQRYLHVVPLLGYEKPEKVDPAWTVPFTLDKNQWTIDAAASKACMFPGTIKDLEIDWKGKLVWKRVEK